eukprot:scaffold4348_cov163-Pinguiococcus_pyrenoidosus.AAC.1
MGRVRSTLVWSCTILQGIPKLYRYRGGLATSSLEVETLFATMPFRLPMCPHKGGIGLKAVDDIADQGGELHPMRPK